MNSNFNEENSNLYNFKAHWNKAYQNTKVTNLGWYEESPQASLDLIAECNLPKTASIFNAGAGASTLINKLLDKGYSNIMVNDIAATALEKLKQQLPSTQQNKVDFITDDLTVPRALLKLKNIHLWHDRAVLHFFTEAAQQQAYFKLLKKVLNPGGYVILAQFNLKGAQKCCGLNVKNYDTNMLQDLLGSDFTLVKAFDYIYTQPSGNTRDYIYTLFQRKAL